MKTHTTALLTSTLIGSVLLAGCGSSTSGPTGSTGSVAGAAGSNPATTAAGAPTSATPAPAATESNPAGDIPDNQAYVAYTPATGGFTVKVPEGWSQSTVGTGTLFSDKYNSIQIVTTRAATPPTETSVTSNDIPVLRGSQPAFASPRVTTADRKAGQAVLLTYQADSAPNPVTGKVALEAVERYTFWKNGTAVVLTLSAPVGSDNVDPWRAVTDSFTWAA